MCFDAVIFDLDGTLLDTLEDLAASMNAVLRRAGLPEHPAGRYRFFAGNGIAMLVRRALPEHEHGERSLRRFTEAMREEYRRRATRTTRPFRGIDTLLDGLAKAGLPKAILSNKPDAETKRLAAELLAEWHFDPLWGAEPSRPLKPDPAAALAIAEHWGLPPKHVALVGDSDVDMRTAVAAGIYPVGALWGFRTARELQSAGARKLAGNPRELLDWITAGDAVRP